MMNGRGSRSRRNVLTRIKHLKASNFWWDVLGNVAASARCLTADVTVIFGKKEADGWLSFKDSVAN